MQGTLARARASKATEHNVTDGTAVIRLQEVVLIRRSMQALARAVSCGSRHWAVISVFDFIMQYQRSNDRLDQRLSELGGRLGFLVQLLEEGLAAHSIALFDSLPCHLLLPLCHSTRGDQIKQNIIQMGKKVESEELETTGCD